MRRILLFGLMWFMTVTVMGQSTRVRGRITDAETGEVIPLVNVVFKGTTTGITTDFDGMYSLETRETVSELQVSFVGYEPQTVKVNPKSFNAIDFKLIPITFDLDEVKVRPGENPAHAILRRVSANKWRNNPDEIKGYNCTTYTKMELDITNINPWFKNKKLQKNFGFIFNNMDTSVITGKSFLPVMISEATADYYHRKSPSFSREVIKASRISGIEEDYSLAQFTGHLHANINFYDNYISIFDVKFASPLSDHGLLYYKYFLVDSMQMEGRKTYKIRFHPKGLSTPVLDGEVNIDSALWALRSANVKMMKGSNVNWVRHLVFENKNRLVNDSVWFPEQDRIFADFSIVMSDSSKILSFLGHRQIDYTGVQIDAPIPSDVMKMDNDIVISPNVLKNDESYWDSIRPYELSDKEKKIYGMVDSIKNVPLYQTLYTVLQTVLGGYYDTKYVGIGPYYKLLSFNKLEGVRFQAGLRTTTDFSRKIRLNGYGAYGTKDNKVKGGGGIEYLFREMPTSKLTASFKHDAVQLGAGFNALTEGNILSSIFSRGNNDRLSIINQGDVALEHEWRHGVSNTVSAQIRTIFPSKYVPFVRPDGSPLKSVQSLALQVQARFSYNEIVVRRGFDKFSLGSDYPILGIDASLGVKGTFKDDYEYYRVGATIFYDLSIPPIGTSKFVINGGKIFGKVPYPLLKLHEGNATYFNDPYAFSCMNYYEFASDLWLSMIYEHHFKGFFLGKIPLMKRLQWRELFTFKAVVGTLEDRNNGSLPNTEAILRFPEGMSSVSKPYFEAGFGIENIFRIFRVDAVWRLSHRKRIPGQDISRFVVNFSVDLKF